MLCGAGLDLEGLQLPLGLEPPESALDDDGRAPQPPEVPARRPAPRVLLDDGGLVLPEGLAGTSTQPVGRTAGGEQERLTHCPELGAPVSLHFGRDRENVPP